MKLLIRIISVVLFCSPLCVTAGDFNVTMMEATCKIQGAGGTGTGFIIGKPCTNGASTAFYTLITADHVLTDMQGETVVLVLRQYEETNVWHRIEVPLQIRDGAKPLWKKHPDVDVAGIFVKLPNNTVRTLVTTDLLIGDKELTNYEINPGMELLCLGYPFGAEGNAQGFPILRSGRIASYPLTPTRQTRTFLFDFTVFPETVAVPSILWNKVPVMRVACIWARRYAVSSG